jgi:hypothetical protein
MSAFPLLDYTSRDQAEKPDSSLTIQYILLIRYDHI